MDIQKKYRLLILLTIFNSISAGEQLGQLAGKIRNEHRKIEEEDLLIDAFDLLLDEGLDAEEDELAAVSSGHSDVDEEEDRNHSFEPVRVRRKSEFSRPKSAPAAEINPRDRIVDRSASAFEELRASSPFVSAAARGEKKDGRESGYAGSINGGSRNDLDTPEEDQAKPKKRES